MAQRPPKRKRGKGRDVPPPVPPADDAIPPSLGLLFTRRQVAAFFGVHPMTITKWQDQGMPIAQHGGKGIESKYRLADVIKWRIDSELQRLGMHRGEALNLEVESARLKRAQAEKTELDVNARRGELLEVEDVEREWSKIIAASKAKLLVLPGLMVQRGLIEPRAEDEARDIVEDALRELADSEASVEDSLA